MVRVIVSDEKLFGRQARNISEIGVPFASIRRIGELDNGEYWMSARDLPIKPGRYKLNKKGKIKKVSRSQFQALKLNDWRAALKVKKGAAKLARRKPDGVIFVDIYSHHHVIARRNPELGNNVSYARIVIEAKRRN